MALTANNTITIDQNMRLYNGYSVGSWVLTAPTVAFNDGARITQLTSPTSVTIHTNNLNLGNQTNGNSTLIKANGVLIDDNGGTIFSSTGLTIVADGDLNGNGNANYIQSVGGTLAINATTSHTSSLTFTSPFGAELVLDGDNGVLLTANNQISIGQNAYVVNQNSNGNWVVMAPTVQIGNNAALEPVENASAASLTIHTNNLQLSGVANGYSFIGGNGVTIDDSGMSTPGLTITTFAGSTAEIYSSNNGGTQGLLVIRSSDELFLTSTNESTGATLLLDGDVGVNLTASNQITIDQKVSVGNNESGGRWIVTSPSVQMNDGSELNTEAVLGLVHRALLLISPFTQIISGLVMTPIIRRYQ